MLYLVFHCVTSAVACRKIDAFVAATVAAVPLRDAIIDDIRAATTTDTSLQQVLRHCQAGWPEVKNLSWDVL